MVFGSEVLAPVDLIYGVSEYGLDLPCHIVFVERLKEKLRESHAFVCEALKQASV